MESQGKAKTRPDTSGGGTFFWWVTVTAAGYLGMLLALGAPHIFGMPLRVGDVAEAAIVAPRSQTVVDEGRTRQAREQAKASVVPVFKRNREIDQAMLSRLSEHLETTSKLKQDIGLPLPDSLGLTPRQQVYLLECPEEVWQRLAAASALAERDTAKASRATSAEEAEPSVRPAVELSLEKQLSELVAASKAGSAASVRRRGRRAAPPPPSPHQYRQEIEQARRRYDKLVPEPSPLSHDLVMLASSVRQDDWPLVRQSIARAAARMLQLGPLFPNVERSDWEQTAIEFLPETWSDKVRLTAARVIASVLEPNVVVDAEATRVKAESAAARVEPVERRIEAGQILVSKGGIITADDLIILNALGIHHVSNWAMVLSLSVSLVAAFALSGIFLYTYEPKHLFSPSSIGLLCTVSVVTCGTAAFAGSDYPQFVPVPAAALVLTVFFGTRTAVVVTLLLMIFLGVDNLVGMTDLIALGTASCAAIGTNIKHRRQLMIRGFLIGILQASGYIGAVILLQSVSSATVLGRELALQFLGGLSSCIVAIGSLPFLENLFGMVTPFRLAELTDSSQPLLRRLEENAPGTYQHSLAVANLSEAGARAIGADVNLVRAGALYHDIGKMVRPRYFIENQLGDKNPHDAMSPEESRDRVLAHVTDGLSLARKYDIPKAVQDFIPQHQGTTLMAYFYHKACQRDGAEKVDPEFYRYPGPKPQSREAAIVMLADVSEAVTHSMKDPSQEEIEAAMSTVFKARWEDGQFSEAGLTWQELEGIKKGFVRVWRTLHHERLKYPATTTGRMAVAPEQQGAASARQPPAPS